MITSALLPAPAVEPTAPRANEAAPTTAISAATEVVTAATTDTSSTTSTPRATRPEPATTKDASAAAPEAHHALAELGADKIDGAAENIVVESAPTPRATTDDTGRPTAKANDAREADRTPEAHGTTTAPKPIATTARPEMMTAVKPGTLSKDDSLKLLVTQLKNQDPLNPLSNDRFIAQSTSFSSLEALQNIQKGIENLGGNNSAQRLTGAAGLLGRPVVACTGTFQWAVTNAAVEVTDSSGTTLAQMPLGARTPGQYSATFIPPTALPAGQYKYRIVSTDGGRSTPLSAIGGSVTGINMQNGQPVLQVGSVTINLADVTTIGTPAN